LKVGRRLVKALLDERPSHHRVGIDGHIGLTQELKQKRLLVGEPLEPPGRVAQDRHEQGQVGLEKGEAICGGVQEGGEGLRCRRWQGERDLDGSFQIGLCIRLSVFLDYGPRQFLTVRP
jgi:hypothetical protein